MDDGYLEIYVPAVPIAQPRQRHRVITTGGKTFAQNYTPEKSPVNAFKATVRQAVRAVFRDAPLQGPISMSAEFIFERPKRLVWKKREMPRQWHTAKPDSDNTLKSLKDALSGVLWRDDAQVCDTRAKKFYAAGDEQPHVLIKIWDLSQGVA